MTQDCSLTPSIADENESIDNKRFPKGIHVTGTDKESGLGIEDVSNGKEEGKGNVTHRNAEDGEKEKPWGYLLIHNRQVDLFKSRWMIITICIRRLPMNALYIIHICIKRRRAERVLSKSCCRQ